MKTGGRSVRYMLFAALFMWMAAPGWADHTTPDIVKGSKVIGKTVQDMAGKELGKIEDLAIDEVVGEVRYAVLSFGGILGVGEKYFAIPWEALTLSDDHKHFVLDVQEKTLEEAPGFNKDSWPDFADPAYYVTVYEFYKVPVPNSSGSKTKNGNKSGTKSKKADQG